MTSKSTTSSTNNKPTVSVIGTAGRGKEIELTRQHFEFMCNHLELYLTENKLTWDSIILVSGGAAWADHVAIESYFRHPETELLIYLPCELVEIKNSTSSNDNNNNNNIKKYQYYDSLEKNFVKNPGRTSNKYHSEFSKTMNRDTMTEIMKAKEIGAVLNSDYHGYHARNTMVAKSDYILAFTLAPGDSPLSPSGTSDTWKKAKTLNKKHIPLPHNFNNNNNVDGNEGNTDTTTTTTTTTSTISTNK
eukprot:gene8527-10482_t